MPRSPASTTRVSPNRSLTLSIWLATVVGPRCCGETSMATGMPVLGMSAARRRSAAGRGPRLWGARWRPAGSPALERGGGDVSYSTAVPPGQVPGRERVLDSCPCRAARVVHRRRTGHLHRMPPARGSRPRELAAVSSRSPRAMASLESGASTCAAAIGDHQVPVPGREPGSMSPSRPSWRAVPRTAATWRAAGCG